MKISNNVITYREFSTLSSDGLPTKNYQGITELIPIYNNYSNTNDKCTGAVAGLPGQNTGSQKIFFFGIGLFLMKILDKSDEKFYVGPSYVKFSPL